MKVIFYYISEKEQLIGCSAKFSEKQKGGEKSDQKNVVTIFKTMDILYVTELFLRSGFTYKLKNPVLSVYSLKITHIIKTFYIIQKYP